ncbi:MAG: CPBP family intramembrane metalloprotease [Planctomycetales bacterium]|nr:CPBP family intramembrane metalloprotease [Planctomycetales bacterium]
MNDLQSTPDLLPAPLGMRDRRGRLARLAIKELREILRDRRTIVTLVFMPLLLYPLLSIAFQRFFLSNLRSVAATVYVIGFVSDAERQYLAPTFHLGEVDKSPVKTRGFDVLAESQTAAVEIAGSVNPDLEAAVRSLEVDAGLRLVDSEQSYLDPRADVALNCEVLFLSDSATGRRAAEHIEQRIAEINNRFLTERLKVLGVTQRAVPVRVFRRGLTNSGTVAPISIAAVIPFILILMTVTGAVYPAIDLTAGERERGTLEILVAAPIPRLGLLLAKYFAVLVCALLTAGANLITVTLTMSVSGLGRMLFGENGISWPVIFAVGGLLVLFAAFFSAVLLMITSFARSFKEAQAYLIPLMLISLAPGMLSLMPGVEQKGLLVVAPLVNIVLLGRDLFEFKASAANALTVVLSTSIYALAAIALAARIFGSESVLYSNQLGWADLFRRTKTLQPHPTLTTALFCLAGLFPAYFILNGLVSQSGGVSLTTRLLMASGVTVVLFAGLPVLAGWHGRVNPRSGFALRVPQAGSLLAAILLGGSLWTLAHELVVLTQNLGLVTLELEQFDKARALLDQLRMIPLPVVILTLAIVPAVCEELFFRGYLFAAFSRAAEPRTAIVGSAIVFGLFHVVVTDALAIERLLPSTFLGLVLAWMRYRSGSVFPGMLLHASHNGLLISVSYFQSQLASAGWGLAEEEHLPVTWLGAAVVVMLVGIGLQWGVSAADDGEAKSLPVDPGMLETPVS